jgi:Ca2+/Na+ antiporter
MLWHYFSWSAAECIRGVFNSALLTPSSRSLSRFIGIQPVPQGKHHITITNISWFNAAKETASVYTRIIQNSQIKLHSYCLLNQVVHILTAGRYMVNRIGYVVMNEKL